MPPTQRLKPARPDIPEAASYKPRFPWRWILLAVTLTTTVTIGYRIKQQGKATALRQQILAVHEQELGPVKDRYQQFRKRIEALVESAADGEPQRYVHPKLKLGGLRSGKGLYLRIPRAAAADAEQLADAAELMSEDAIVRCLGLTAASARGLYEQGDFLTDSWAEATREQDGVMELRVSDEMLAQAVERDLPSVMSLLRSNWFMLVLENGDNRNDAPVDVFLWDLASEDLLLSARVQARGVYFRARIAAEGAKPYLAKEGGVDAGGGAADCSIAAQLRALQGGALTEVQSQATSEDATGTDEPSTTAPEDG